MLCFRSCNEYHSRFSKFSVYFSLLKYPLRVHTIYDLRYKTCLVMLLFNFSS